MRRLRKEGWSQQRIAEELQLSGMFGAWIRQERLPLTVAKALVERFTPERAKTITKTWVIESPRSRRMASSGRATSLAKAFDTRVSIIRPISSAPSAPPDMPRAEPDAIAQLTREVDALILTNARLVQERAHFAKELVAAQARPDHSEELITLQRENTKLREEMEQWIREAEAAVTRAENAEAVLAASKLIPCAESLPAAPTISQRTLARAEELGVKLDLGGEIQALPK